MTTRRQPRRSPSTGTKVRRARKRTPGSRRREPPDAAGRKQPAASPVNRKTTILIIDDEEVVRSFIREALRGAGFDTVEARNGLEGLDRYRASPTDMVITDLVMPEAGGQEVILELTWGTPSAKILAITGQAGDPGFLGVAERFGATRTLAKPFTREQLMEAVKAVLRDKRQHPRIEVELPISFEGDGTAGRGRVINVSRGGCAVESDAHVASGSYLHARLTLPGEPAPLAVDLAVVRWTTGPAFGCEFIRMGPETQAMLRRYLESLHREQRKS